MVHGDWRSYPTPQLPYVALVLVREAWKRSAGSNWPKLPQLSQAATAGKVARFLSEFTELWRQDQGRHEWV